MNWGAIGTIAEIIGAVAVVATLAYLAIQIRQGTDNDRVQGIQQLGRDWATHSALVTSDENVTTFIKGLNAYGKLSPEERMKFDFCVGGYINLGEVALSHADVDRLHELIDAVNEYLGPRLFAYPGLRDWWHHGNKGGVAETTQEWVDAQIFKNKETIPYWESKQV